MHRDNCLRGDFNYNGVAYGLDVGAVPLVDYQPDQCMWPNSAQDMPDIVAVPQSCFNDEGELVHHPTVAKFGVTSGVTSVRWFPSPVVSEI